MNNAKTPSAVSPSSAPGWDPFGQNASAAQGISKFIALGSIRETDF
jgi:hypothetical protein